MTVRYIHTYTDRQIHAGFKHLFGASRTADEKAPIKVKCSAMHFCISNMLNWWYLIKNLQKPVVDVYTIVED